MMSRQLAPTPCSVFLLSTSALPSISGAEVTTAHKKQPKVNGRSRQLRQASHDAGPREEALADAVRVGRRMWHDG